MSSRLVYRVNLEAMDYVFHATFQVGRVYRTGPTSVIMPWPSLSIGPAILDG
ncbi:MAG: hypothetical protein NZ742_02520 [Acidobacteria bacterium]|nr:hypothetical protein [Acidobacteriota bacterium]MDW7983215.1 hypothetical protein [Acidobacteriota bacterium]